MENSPQPTSKVSVIKNIYFYLVSFVALMMVTFSTADVINTVLRTYVFKKADRAFYGYSKPFGCEPMAARDPNIKPLSPEECTKQEAEARKEAEENRLAEKQRNVVRDISMIVVGIPLFILHWGAVRKKE